ncbi:unnamed protein product [Linum tenue]|uniref:Uncharacterized protein n=1 Tax=Linum tenue TaxID=586396 RepID=A0AAV0MYA2_9ROSI|nr:unnamed protein product [Linum tenue]
MPAAACRRSTSSSSSAATAAKRPKVMMSCRKLGKYLKQQQGRLYIIRRCVVMLICWRD